MKIKQIKWFSLILSLFIFISCSNQSANYGILTLEFPQQNTSRSAYSLDQLSFSVSIKNQETQELFTQKIETNNSPVFSIELVPGVYSLEIDGFTTAEDSTKTLVYRGQTFDIEVKAGEETKTSLTLYLVFTFTFNANGGTGEMPSFVLRKDSEYELPECTFTPENTKHFSHWSTSPENEDSYLVNDKYTVSQNITFYAIWENDTVKEKPFIIFNEETEERMTVYFADYSYYDDEGVFIIHHTFEAKSKYKMETYKWLIENKEVSEYPLFKTKTVDPYTTQLIYGETIDYFSTTYITLIYSYYNENNILTYDTVSFFY